ncbi:MAG: DUF3857 domain-containing protein [Pseudomonadota bacterium]
MKFLYLLIFISHLAIAQQNQSISWGSPSSNEWNDIKTVISQVKLEDHKEFTEIVAKVDISISKNTVVEKITKVLYFPDIGAIQNNGIDRVPFNNELDKIKFISITTINKNGEEKYFSKEDLKINDSNSYNTFSSMKNAVFSYPGLTVQSFVILSYVITKNIEHRESDWSREAYPQTYYPRENYSIKIHWQENMAIQWHNTSTFVECLESNNSIKCHGKKIPKALSDDTFFWADQLNSLQIGQHKSWNETISHVLEKFQKSQIDLPVIDSFTKKLVSNKNNMEEKISAIQRFVSQEVQYISLSEHGNAFTPHAVSRTLEKRMGDCKDKSALLFSMLTSIGLKPYPVLVVTDREKITNNLQPSMNLFDHMIICFDAVKKNYCIDATNSYSDWKYISPGIQGKVALPLIAGSSLINIPSSTYFYTLTTHSDFTFLKDGRQTEFQKREYIDEYASRYRSFFAVKSAKEINDWLLDNYHENVANKPKPEFTIDGISDVDKKIIVTSKAEFEPFVDVEADLDYIESDAWILSELGGALIPNKVYEYNTKGLKVSSTITFDISRNWTIKILPATTNLIHKYGSMTRTIRKINSGKAEVVTQLEIPKKLIPFNEIENFNSFIKLLKQESSISFYGEKLELKGSSEPPPV